jgi:peptide-methionine (R)-S-oxide reductase
VPLDSRAPFDRAQGDLEHFERSGHPEQRRGVHSRRQFLVVLASGAGLVPLIGWLTAPSTAVAGHFPVTRTEDKWRQVLSSAQFRVLRRQATERPFTSPLYQEHRHGVFKCAGCGRELFASSSKFESGTGWPSFWRPMENAVATSVDRSWLMVRTEVHCAGCGGHLGHLFGDGPQPTGLRYCINGVALTFEVRL